jgi:hypothetical protein
MRTEPIYPLFESLEIQRQHYSQRKKEIEELITMLKLRVEAESIYAQNLYRIAERSSDQCIQVGLLAQEVSCFKQDCQSKAKAAEELADNVAQDCVMSLQQLIDEQD